MRLRPSGKAGPIAVSASTFARYQRDEAWVWEQMALTRARVVAGPPALAHEIDCIIRSVLTRPRDADALVVEVADMRARMASELTSRSIWEVKHHRGGLVDIEFIAQYLQLLHAHAAPDVLSTNTREALVRLCGAGDCWRRMRVTICSKRSVFGRRCRTGSASTSARRSPPSAPSDAPKALRLAVDGLGGLDFDSLVIKMQAAAERVHGHFRRIVEEPAAVVRDRLGKP